MELHTSLNHTSKTKQYRGSFRCIHAVTWGEYTSKENTFSFEWINVSSTKEVLNWKKKYHTINYRMPELKRKKGKI